MKGIIFDIKRFAIHDGPGLRTTVFFKGCPLNCWWCHNPESISSNIEHYNIIEKIGDKEFTVAKTVGRVTTPNEVMIEILKERVFMEQGNGGVTLSGGEPLLQYQFASELLKLCKKHGINTAIDTSGAVSISAFKAVLPFTDIFLFDIKLITASLHKKYIGVDNELIISNFKNTVKAGKKVIARIPLIPKVNLNNTELNHIIEFLLPFKCNTFNEIHLLPFHNIGKAKYERFNRKWRMNNTKEPDINELQPVVDLFISKGFNVTLH